MVPMIVEMMRRCEGNRESIARGFDHIAVFRQFTEPMERVRMDLPVPDCPASPRVR